MRPSIPAVRSAILFVGGLSGIAHQTLVATSERPTLLVVYAAMIGLPAFLKQDEKRAEPPKKDEEDPS